MNTNSFAKTPLMQDNSYSDLIEEQAGARSGGKGQEAEAPREIAERGIAEGEGAAAQAGGVAETSSRAKILFSDGLGSGPRSWKDFFKTFGKFIGPGFMVSVGYLDPGNW